MNGAKVVVRAWCDPKYRKRLLEDGTEKPPGDGRWPKRSGPTPVRALPNSLTFQMIPERKEKKEADLCQESNPHPDRPG